jgi:hypothetical protein
MKLVHTKLLCNGVVAVLLRAHYNNDIASAHVDVSTASWGYTWTIVLLHAGGVAFVCGQLYRLVFLLLCLLHTAFLPLGVHDAAFVCAIVLFGVLSCVARCCMRTNTKKDECETNGVCTQELLFFKTWIHMRKTNIALIPILGNFTQ